MADQGRLNAIGAGHAVRKAYADMLKWQEVQRAMTPDKTERDEQSSKPAKLPPPTNRAQRRRAIKQRGGFKKGRRR